MIEFRGISALTIACVATLAVGGCSASTSGDAGDPDASAAADAWVTVADVSADLAPRLERNFGEASLMCGMTDPFGGGFAAGPLREGNAMGCTYMSSDETFRTGEGAVWLDLIVSMVSDSSYVYAVMSGAGDAAEAQGLAGIGERVPESLYRDGLTCEQLIAPLAVETVPGPDFAPVPGANLAGDDGMSYPEVVYYWFDGGRPAALDPSGEGRPCSEQFPAEEVDAFFDGAIEVSGTATGVAWTEPLITTFEIRSTLAAAEEMPAEATQVDCALVGPVARGSVFTCAPRLNRAPDSRIVAIVTGDGGFLTGPSLEETVGGDEPPLWVYADGLSCEQIREPVAEDTFSSTTGMTFEEATAQMPSLTSRGLTYLGAVLYAFTTKDATMIQFDSSGWPCTSTYPPQEVAEVQEQVQFVGE